MKLSPLIISAIISAFALTACENNSPADNPAPIETTSVTTTAAPLAETTTAVTESELTESRFKDVNSYDGAAMSVSAITDGGVSVEIAYSGDNTGTYGEEYYIEMEKDEVWYSLPYIIEDNIAFPGIGYDLKPGEIAECSIDYEPYYGKLPAGHYRVIKSILDFRKPGDFDTHCLSAEFIIE